jgi:hypothetical protein
MLFGFAAYRSFVFPASQRPIAVQVRDFLAVNAATLVVVAAVAILLRQALLLLMEMPLAEAAAHALAIALGAVLNYLGHSRLTFAEGLPTACLIRPTLADPGLALAPGSILRTLPGASPHDTGPA